MSLTTRAWGMACFMGGRFAGALFLGACVALAAVASGPSLYALASAGPATRPSTLPATVSTSLPAPPAPTSAAFIRRRIVELGDDDPKVRQHAENDLVFLGPKDMELMRAVRGAAASDDPELAARARAVLTRMRWEGPGDPEPARALTLGAASKPPAERCERIDLLAALPSDQGRHALFRIVRLDTSPAVRWHVVDRMRQGPPPFDPPALADLEAPGAPPAALALAAWAWESHDYPRAGKLYERAVDSSPMPTNSAQAAGVSSGPGAGVEFVPVPDYVYQSLMFYENWAGHYARTARMLRRQIDEAALASGTALPDKLDELIAIQGGKGPLPGLGWDLVRASGALNRPQVLYGLNRLFLRKGWRLAADYARYCALTETGPDSWKRHSMAMYLASHGWDDLAEGELRELLARGDAVGDPNAADAHFMLAGVAMRRGDHAGACRELEAGLDRAGNMNIGTEVEGRSLNNDQTRRNYRILMQGHGLIAARDSSDKAAEAARATELARLINDDASGDASGPLPLGFSDLQNFTMIAVPVLKQAGKDDAAARLFHRAYDAVADRLRRDSENPYAMNAVVILCVNCGDHLDEAKALGAKAVARDPNNGYFLDALAECVFQLGDAKEAVRLERQAAEKKSFPPDVQNQLRRFETGSGASRRRVTRPVTQP